MSGQEHRYVLYVPESLDLARPAPLVVFLHGKGECGTDNHAQLRVGLPPALLAQPKRWPCLVLIPQRPDPEKQWEDYDGMLMAQLQAVQRDYRIDPNRIYVTGLSQGGHGTWAFGARHPDRWAALAPICGYGDPAQIAGSIKDIPTWAFHGGKDDAVPPAQSEAMVAALVDAGNTSARLTVFPDAGHNSWDRVYRDSGLAEWMLAITKGRRSP